MNPDIISFYRKEKPRHSLSLRYLLFMLASFDIISVETRALYHFLKAEYPFFQRFKDKIYYIPNGIDVTKTSAFSKRFRDKEKVILHIGRIGAHQKASEIILEAFSRVCQEFPDWKLVLVGPIEEGFLETLKKSVREKGLEGKVTYLGFIESRREVYEQYSRAKILALPSRFEGFSLAAIEGMSFGDVLLGSDIPSFRDITDEGRLGYLCPVDDISCFTDTLRYMLSHDVELEYRSEESVKFAKTNFDWSAICMELNKHIVRCIESKDPST
jgi:glycosyltransferase involved in cell wall biosynthesis